MQFYRAHGLGNDYLALEMAELPGEMSPAVVRLICDRHRGVGSDGILARVRSDRAEFGLRIFNPDGTEAEKSGNGLRIFAAYLLDRGHVGVGEAFTVETKGGLVEMEVISADRTGLMVEVEMGVASFRTGDVGLAGPDREDEDEWLELGSGERVAINPVSMGNPHCVVFVDELDAEDLRRRGPELSTHSGFARGTNVQLARVSEDGKVDALVWERGAGETLASGSSACAVAAVAVRRGLVSGPAVEVRMPGGSLQVTVRDDWRIHLRGPVEGICRGALTADHIARIEELG
jgi:diaminopimelate epimerase